MTTTTRSSALRLVASITLILLLAAPARALEVEITDGVGTVTITDDGPGDLNVIDPKVIDFDLTANPTIPDLAGGGRIRQVATDAGQTLTFSATPPNTVTTLRNVGAGSLSIKVTIRSDNPYPAVVGPALGWRLFYNGQVADPTPADVDVTGHTAELFINGSAAPIASATVPDLHVLGNPPVAFSTSAPPDSDAVASATSSQLVLSVTLGIGDHLNLPPNSGTEADGLQGAIFNHDAKCAGLMNKSAGSVAMAEQKGDVKCVKAQAKTGGDATACVDGLDANGDKAEGKLQTKFIDFDCQEASAWGVNTGRCCNHGPNDGATCLISAECGGGGTCLAGACIGGAAQAAANDFSHDVFGASIVVGTDAVAKCQKQVFTLASKSIGAVWAKFAQCKKKNAGSIANDADLATTCLDPLAIDATSKFAKMEPKILKSATKCEDKGVTPVAPNFGGACSAAASPAEFATCVTNLAKCRFCLGVLVADDIDPGDTDCDIFDDNVANASCTP